MLFDLGLCLVGYFVLAEYYYAEFIGYSGGISRFLLRVPADKRKQRLFEEVLSYKIN